MKNELDGTTENYSTTRVPFKRNIYFNKKSSTSILILFIAIFSIKIF